MRVSVLIVTALCSATIATAQMWTPLGPPGGDVRALAVDPSRPSRVFLGTADGHIFGSEDAGTRWKLLGRASARPDAVITSISVDPRDGDVLLASSWERDSAAGGGIARSVDGGRTWTPAGLAGQPVRALARAPSDPNLLVAGTLDGVYRSLDGAQTWQRISPEHHPELRNLDALAIDPREPQTIYAGTFHLPWKTSDGGASWRPVHDGMIDDSDVMSLLVDADSPGLIYASACSGIYRSDDGALAWRKIQGIPYTARRTYAIAQDPKQPARIYAATSEGLWKTADAGNTWRRTTPESWVVNAVVVASGDPARVLIGTEEYGVLESEDGGEHFEASNSGFEHRQIVALTQDPQNPSRILAVLAHTPQPVMFTADEGLTWSALGSGLQAEQVLRVYAAPDGSWWASLVRGGLMRYDDRKDAWKSAGSVPAGALQSIPNRPAGQRLARRRAGAEPLSAVVSDVEFSSNHWYAATSAGLLISDDRGATWRPMPVGSLGSLPVRSVQVSTDSRRIRVVSLRGLAFSDDGGASWNWHDLPLASGGASALEAVPGDAGTLIAAAQNGMYISRDRGNSWKLEANGLPATPVQGFAATDGLFIAAMRTGGLYASRDSGRTWDRLPGPLSDGRFMAVGASIREPGVIFAASETEGLYRVEWQASSNSVTRPQPQ